MEEDVRMSLDHVVVAIHIETIKIVDFIFQTIIYLVNMI